MLYMLGGAGVSNFGDEFMVRRWLEFYKEHGLEGELTIDGASAENLSGLFGGIYRKASFVSVFNALKYSGPDNFWESLRRGLNFYDNGGLNNYREFKKWSEKIISTKLMHLHGGGYINEIWPQSAFLLGVAAATKLKYNCKLVGTGIGLLPLSKVPDLYRDEFNKIINTFDFIECRDYDSYLFLKNSVDNADNIFYGLDDTYLAHVDNVSNVDGCNLHISYFSKAKESLHRLLNKLPDEYFNKFSNVYFWECTMQDRECFDIVKAKHPKVKLLDYRDLVLNPLPVNAGDEMITARFHPHLLAARKGVAGYYREDGSYYDVKQGSVVDLGSPFKSIEKITASHISQQDFNRIVSFEDARVAMKRILGARIVEYYKNSN
ncbi:polysaccharide pyruvyl transferase family protein [Pseudochrobactrum saccharolyticum]|uniref:polysaccharide pyruvyl transferase family protein n=1 Tax=Pseudochrobactrum saccharolyticum TaxID=354352 RepID=UPI002758E6BD|nr:polysaccharide pyruvyl transferase family protein [Pseudochrobactrum saccharolyticum]MDP8249728.1 polysaccharide pyruvyl transferase family protein [Pseudochrobactrum saccharolyticum]